MPYETFVKDRLVASPAASAAQVHDWLKEHHSPFPKISPKTVYNFVMAIRLKQNIPLEKASRDYFIVDQLAYGLQAQADPVARVWTVSFTQPYHRGQYPHRILLALEYPRTCVSKLAFFHGSTRFTKSNTKKDCFFLSFLDGILVETVFGEDTYHGDRVVNLSKVINCC